MKRRKFITRYGKTKKDVLRRWQWNHPDTVVDEMTYNETLRPGVREYFIWYHERKKPSKKSKKIHELKKRGVKFGKPTLRRRKK